MSKLLLAEDDPHIAKLIEFKLKKEGFEVVIAKNGQEALEQHSRGSWDLLILDIMMPLLDGLEVLRRVRATPDGAEVPILMLTAKGRTTDATHAAELGATQFLRKPFDPAELVAVVKKMLESGA